MFGNSTIAITSKPCTRKQAGVRMLCSYYMNHHRAVAGLSKA
jgi:hypothetical protein